MPRSGPGARMTAASASRAAWTTICSTNVFCSERGATHLIAPQIEGAEGKIAVATARQIGLRALVPTDCRSLTGSYFAATRRPACRPTPHRVTI